MRKDSAGAPGTGMLLEGRRGESGACGVLTPVIGVTAPLRGAPPCEDATLPAYDARSLPKPAVDRRVGVPWPCVPMDARREAPPTAAVGVPAWLLWALPASLGVPAWLDPQGMGVSMDVRSRCSCSSSSTVTVVSGRNRTAEGATGVVVLP